MRPGFIDTYTAQDINQSAFIGVAELEAGDICGEGVTELVAQE